MGVVLFVDLMISQVTSSFKIKFEGFNQATYFLNRTVKAFTLDLIRISSPKEHDPSKYYQADIVRNEREFVNKECPINYEIIPKVYLTYLQNKNKNK